MGDLLDIAIEMELRRGLESESEDDMSDDEVLHLM